MTQPDTPHAPRQPDRGGETVDMRASQGAIYKPSGPVTQHFGTRIHVHTHASPAGIPLQRPPRAPHFTDRKRELARLLDDLGPGRVATLCGPGGIGKTALAAEAVWTLAPGNEPPDRFPDGILLHSFYGQPDPALALEHIALSFGEEIRPTPAEAALRALAGKQALLILDGAEETADLGAVLDVRGGCGVLVTSRARRDALATRQDVEPLEATDAVELLRKWGGDRAADTHATRQICQLVGRLPLAVRLAGRYLAETGESAAGYLEWLRETPLDALDHGQRRHQSVRVLLEKSLAQVSDAARQVLAVVGLLALAPFDREPIAAALDLPPNQLHKPLGELVSYGLLLPPSSPPPGGIEGGLRYTVSHALVHTYAQECCRPADEIAGRLAGYYDTLARDQRELGPQGYARLDAERAHLMRVLHACVEGEMWEAARSLVWAVDGYLDMCGYWTERVQALEMGIQAARKVAHRRDEEAFLIMLGLAHAALGQVERAVGCYERAVIICREIGHRQDEGNALGNLGMAYRRLGEVRRAIAYYEAALEIDREIGNRRGEGADLGNLGLAYADLGEVRRAIGAFEQGLEIAREMGDRRGEGARLGNLGLAYADLGDVRRAIGYYEQALEIAREIGDRRNEGNALGSLGGTYHGLGEMRRAIAYYEAALEIAREIGDRHGEGNRLGNLGRAYAALGEVRRAIATFEQALEIAREIGDRPGEGARLGNLGTVYHRLGEVGRAIGYYEQALEVAREIGDRRGAGNHLGNLGSAYATLGDPARARTLWEQALCIFEDVEDPNAERVRGWLAALRAE